MTASAVHPDPTPVAHGSVEVAGSVTRYWIWGDPAAEQTLVAVHGFRGDHHGLLPVIARLSGYRVITPDLPGFGASAPFRGPVAECDGKHDVSAYAGWLRALCAELVQPERFVLLGHSFGSVISAAAVAAGLRPRSLVLINPIAGPALEGPRAVLSRLAVAYYRLGAALPEPVGRALLGSRVIVRLLSEVMAATADRRLRHWIHDQHRRYFSTFADRRVVVEAFEASVAHHVGEYADRITVPTLLIGGDRDDIVPVPALQRLARRLPDSRLLLLAGVGHLIHYEQPEPAAAAITEFVRRHS